MVLMADSSSSPFLTIFSGFAGYGQLESHGEEVGCGSITKNEHASHTRSSDEGRKNEAGFMDKNCIV